MVARASVYERFDQKWIPEPNSGCWLWFGTLSAGYGQIWKDGRHVGAHRVAYERWVGAIPDGKELDHLCRVRCCVNPAHLEPVVHKDNMMRSPIARARVLRSWSHCHAGHEFTPDNTYCYPGTGWRHCRACARIRDRRRRSV